MCQGRRDWPLGLDEEQLVSPFGPTWSIESLEKEVTPAGRAMLIGERILNPSCHNRDTKLQWNFPTRAWFVGGGP